MSATASAPPFGRLPDGRVAQLVTLRQADGFEVDVTDFGGIVTAIRVPGGAAGATDVALGFATLEGYLRGHPYFGAITGRVAGRIAGAAFELDGRRYALAANDPPSHLHGGRVGFDKRLWRTAAVTPDSVTLTYLSPNGEEGYPGTVAVTVNYRVEAGNTLVISHEAVTDRPTPFALTNHTYFNLDGEGAGSALGHTLQVRADTFAPTDEQLAPLGRSEPVVRLGNDFREPARLQERLERLWQRHGDFYVLNERAWATEPAARLWSGNGRLRLDVFSTEPGVQFYTGRFLDGTLRGKSGRPYGPYGGLCLECQNYPGGRDRAGSTPWVLRPGETARGETRYRFERLAGKAAAVTGR